MEQQQALSLTLPVRQLVEFLLRRGSIDNRFTGFDRANEGARLHRKLQRAATAEHPDYKAEVFLRYHTVAAQVDYTIEGRADGIFTAPDGVTTVDEIKTTALPSASITGEQSPEHWAQGQVYAYIYATQNDLAAVRVQLTYYQIDEELTLRFSHDYTRQQLEEIVTGLLEQYAPWAQRAARWKARRTGSLTAMRFPFADYRPGQKAMLSAVYQTCAQGGQLLCQAPTGIGKTISVLFPALKAMGDGGPVFYLTARGTTRAAAENAIAALHEANPGLTLRSITLTAKDKICLTESHECTPEACPYANGYFDRIKDALWETLDADTLTAQTLTDAARKHTVCPFEMGLDLSLWCDVIIGDYNYLFDPVVSLKRFFESAGDYLFLIDEAHNLPDRARDMHTESLLKSEFTSAKKLLGKGKGRLKTAIQKVNNALLEWRHHCEEEGGSAKTLIRPNRDEELDRMLNRLCEPLEAWLDEHRTPDENHAALLQLYFDVRAWLRVAETFDDHFVLQATAFGSDVRLTQLCLDPSAFLQQNFVLGRASVLFSATLAPPSYYKDLCGLPDARAVALKSPFPQENFALYCACNVSTRYRDREAACAQIADYLAEMTGARTGNYIAFFPSYQYLDKVRAVFEEKYPNIPVLVQQTALDEAGREEFLARFAPDPDETLLAFAVLGGVFGEGVDLAGSRLIGAAVVGPGLPQVGARQEQLRDYFERTRGSGFDYAYRYPGMNKVLQAAGRVIRTPQDRGVVLLIDDRFSMWDYRRLMPPHWSHFTPVYDCNVLRTALEKFWQTGNPDTGPEETEKPSQP